jgi:Spy/CpxP family protein refolding chaperone
MSRWHRSLVVIVAVVALLLAASPTLAQSGRSGGGGANIMSLLIGNSGMLSAALLRSEQVQKELSITDDQMQRLMEEGQRLMGDFAGFRDMSPDEQKKKLEDVEKTIGDKLVSILTSEQHKRLKEISVQVLGAVVLLNPEVAKQLEITEEQKQRLRDAAKMVEMEIGEIRSIPREQMPDKIQQARKDFDFDAMAILTTQQRDKFDQMKGAKVDIDITTLMGIGRRPGG